MKKSRPMIACMTILMLMCAPGPLFAQTTTSTAQAKQFVKDGVSFDYPGNWTLSDMSTPDMQHLVLTLDGTNAQIMVIIPRGKVEVKQGEETRKALAERFLNGMTAEFEKDGTRVERSLQRITIAGRETEGARLRVAPRGRPGNVEAYSLLLGNRIVVLTLLRPDTDGPKAAVAWDTLRNSLKVEAST